MAIGEFFVYKRPNAAQDYDSFEKSYKGSARGYTSLTSAAPATTAGLPLRAGAGTYPQFTSGDEFQDIVQTSGQIKKIGDKYGVLITDMKAGSDAEWAISGLFSLRLEAGATVTIGGDAYIDPATMRVHHDSTGREYLGIFQGAPETNPLARPAGDYANVFINQTEL